MSAIAWHIQARPCLELKSWPRFCPVGLRFVHVVSIETMNGSKTGKTDVNRLIIKELEKNK